MVYIICLLYFCLFMGFFIFFFNSAIYWWNNRLYKFFRVTTAYMEGQLLNIQYTVLELGDWSQVQLRQLHLSILTWISVMAVPVPVVLPAILQARAMAFNTHITSSNIQPWTPLELIPNTMAQVPPCLLLLPLLHCNQVCIFWLLVPVFLLVINFPFYV